MSFPFGQFSPTGGAQLIFYLSTQTSTANASSYTFAATALGAADADRKIFVGVALNVSQTVTALTVGGVTAKKIKEIGTTDTVTWFLASVPSGTTGDIVVTCSGTSNECYITVYRSTIPSPGLVATGGIRVGTGSVNTLTLSDLAVRPGGFALVLGGNSGVGSVQTETYNGTDTLVVDDERDSEARRFSSCSVLTTESSDTNDFTFSSALNQSFYMCGVSYIPLTGAAYAPNLASTFSSTADASTYTFNTQGIGVANSARQLLICFGWASGSGRTVTSVTVNGNAATAVQFAGSGTGGCAMYRYALAAGTTADIVITMSGTCVRLGGGVYDTRPRGTLAPIDTGTANVTATSVSSADVEVREGGFLIAVGTESSTETMTATYNGVDTLAKDNEQTLESANNVGLFSCLTTEYALTNDPGFSATSSNAKRHVAAAWL